MKIKLGTLVLKSTHEYTHLPQQSGTGPGRLEPSQEKPSWCRRFVNNLKVRGCSPRAPCVRRNSADSSQSFWLSTTRSELWSSNDSLPISEGAIPTIEVHNVLTWPCSREPPEFDNNGSNCCVPNETQTESSVTRERRISFAVSRSGTQRYLKTTDTGIYNDIVDESQNGSELPPERNGPALETLFMDTTVKSSPCIRYQGDVCTCQPRIERIQVDVVDNLESKPFAELPSSFENRKPSRKRFISMLFSNEEEPMTYGEILELVCTEDGSPFRTKYICKLAQQEELDSPCVQDLISLFQREIESETKEEAI